MPELPEVESVVRRLRSKLIGRRVLAVELRWLRMLQYPDKLLFERQLIGGSIKDVWRRAKYIVVTLENALAGKATKTFYLFLHLRMSGDLLVREADVASDPYDRVVFMLDDKSQLRFNDIRKFGRIILVENELYVTADLGPEPLEKSFTEGVFRERLKGRRGAIKTLLLKQSFLSGIGNIYADETLWRARIHPLKQAEKLKDAEISSLHKAIPAVLNEAIKRQGTNIGDDVVPLGAYRVRVYGREGQPCRRCQTPIKRIVIGQRSAHFCPLCQAGKQPSRRRSRS